MAKPAKKEVSKITFSKIETTIYIAILVILLFVFFHEIIFKKGFFWEDFLEQNYPCRLYAARALHNGQFPFWNPYIFGGLPFFADAFSGVLFPSNLLLTFAYVGNWLSYYVVEIFIILHLLIAGIGMYYFAINNNLRKKIAFFMSMVYMLNGRFIVHLTHTQMIQTFVFIPFVFLFLQKGLNRQGLKAVYSIVICGFILGLAGLAGYPQAVLIIIVGISLFTLYHIILNPSKTISLSSYFFLILIICAAIIACQYIPTYLLLKYTLRGEYPYSEIVEGSFHPLRFITFLIPNFFGTTARGNYSTYFGPGPYYQYWEQMAYIGILPIILAGFSFYKRNRKQIYLPIILVIVSLLIALGRHFPLHILLYKFVPFFKDVRTPAKFLNLTIFGIVWLSGIGLENIISIKPKARRLVLIGIVLSIICLVLIFFLPKQVTQLAKSIAVRDIIKSIVIILLGVFFIRLYLNNKLTKNYFLGFIIALAFVDIFAFGYKYNSGDTDPEMYWGANRIVNFFKSESQKEMIRVNIRSREGLILPRNIGYVQEFATIDGYHLSIKTIYNFFTDIRPRTVFYLDECEI